MEKAIIVLWSSLISFILVFSLATEIIAQEVEDESEFNYIRGDEKGPENWGNIKEEWATCNTGRMQSPINLVGRTAKVIPKSEKIFKFYRPDFAVLKNRGHDITLAWKGQRSKIRINNIDYILQQGHWHSPSEHAINGKRSALELHLVHQSADNDTAVIGLLYDLGAPDPFLSKLERKITLISDTSAAICAGIINPAEIMMRGIKYFRYNGSLTTPPCTEGVIWTVYKQVGTVSLKQVKLLREAVNDDAMENARPLQPLNGREVKLYATRTIKKETLTNKSFLK